MSFNIKNKVGIITGAASGIGFLFAKDLLAVGLRNVAVLDVNKDAGEKCVKELCDEFGSDKAIFIKTDVSADKEFEGAFKESLRKFKNVDILINNAGIADEAHWSRLLDINLKGVLRGTLLGLNYISKYKTADSGLIVNVASTASLSVFPGIPFYTSAKSGVMQASRCFGDTIHYNKTKVRVLAICPGATNTPLYHEGVRRTYSPDNQNTLDRKLNMTTFPIQEPSHVSKSLISLIGNATSGSVWVIENGEEAYELEFPERLGTKKQ